MTPAHGLVEVEPGGRAGSLVLASTAPIGRVRAGPCSFLSPFVRGHFCRGTAAMPSPCHCCLITGWSPHVVVLSLAYLILLHPCFITPFNMNKKSRGSKFSDARLGIISESASRRARAKLNLPSCPSVVGTRVRR